jgi:ATP synthase protein I
MADTSDKKPADEKEKKREFVRYIGVASTVGINLVVSTFVGFALGYWVLDRYLNSYPWFTIVLTFLGIVAGFRFLFKIAQKAGEKEEE